MFTELCIICSLLKRPQLAAVSGTNKACGFVFIVVKLQKLEQKNRFQLFKRHVSL